MRALALRVATTAGAVVLAALTAAAQTPTVQPTQQNGAAVDPITAELMLRTVGRLTERHLVLFMLMKDAELETLLDAEPRKSEDVARSVIAGNLLRERELVIARLKRLGAHVVEADHRRLGPELVQRYLDLKRENLL